MGLNLPSSFLIEEQKEASKDEEECLAIGCGPGRESPRWEVREDGKSALLYVQPRTWQCVDVARCFDQSVTSAPSQLLEASTVEAGTRDGAEVEDASAGPWPGRFTAEALNLQSAASNQKTTKDNKGRQSGSAWPSEPSSQQGEAKRSFII